MSNETLYAVLLTRAQRLEIVEKLPASDTTGAIINALGDAKPAARIEQAATALRELAEANDRAAVIDVDAPCTEGMMTAARDASIRAAAYHAAAVLVEGVLR